MRLRYATDDDVPAVARVQTAAAREFGPGYYTEAQLDHWARERDPDDYDFDDGVHVVAESADGVVGWGWVRPERSELSAVYVHPDHAREGVGTRVLDRLETEAGDRGCTALSLWSSLPAVPFYDANGYRTVRRVELGEASLPSVVMRKLGVAAGSAGVTSRC